MSGAMIEDEDLLRATEYALSIVRRTEQMATTDGLEAEYQAALSKLTAYLQALQAADVSRARKGHPF
jgi:hypothetical protein